MFDFLGSQVFDTQPAVVASTHDDGVVLFHTGNGQMFTANKTGARIWECIERHLTAEAIVSEITTRYAIEREAAEAHTKRFLNELLRRELVTPGTIR